MDWKNKKLPSRDCLCPETHPNKPTVAECPSQVLVERVTALEMLSAPKKSRIKHRALPNRFPRPYRTFPWGGDWASANRER